MNPISISDLIEAVEGKLIKQGVVCCITGVSIDSRNLMEGDLFIPLKGERFDGHDYIGNAIEKGAVAVFTEKADIIVPDKVYVIYTENSLHSLQRLSAFYLRSFHIPVVAVTGSTGKTTTKDMISSVLSEKYSVLKTQGNFNNEIGLPLTLLQLRQGHELVVLEMGMSGLGEISRLVEIASPHIGIITNIGVSHIEKLGSRENICRAKMEIFNQFTQNCTAVLNGDDDMLSKVRDTFPYPLKTFGFNEGVDVRAYNLRLSGEEGCTFELAMEGETYKIKLGAPGRHNVYNSLAAIIVGKYFGLNINEIQNGLLHFQSGKMRLNVYTTENGIKVIDDAYNASPDSMRAALDILKDFSAVRRIAILGDMLELGSYSKYGHQEVGNHVVLNNVDILITKGVASVEIGHQAIIKGMSFHCVYHFDTNHEVINWLENNLISGDTILIKGSRGMEMEEIAGYVRESRK